ncbi:MAG: hypothetical protein WAS36_00290 [Candidatus Saccharimonadales bacterium]
MDKETTQPAESSSSLETTNDENSLENATASATQTTGATKTEVPKKAPKKHGLRGINIYLLLFILLLILSGVIVAATYLASKNSSKTDVPTQSLSSDALKQLATSDVTVGQPKQVLNVQSNAVFAGKVLIRDSLEVAGTIQVGGTLNIPGITVSGNSIFEQIQVNKNLGVQGDTTMQGQLTVQKNLTVAGGATFGGAISAPQLSVNTLQLNGNLTITRHLVLGGSTPGRTAGNALGAGGTVAVSGSDSAGSVNINTGSSPSAGCFVTVNFAQRFNATPKVATSPVGSGAARLPYFITRNSTSFSICTADPAPAFASFSFDYIAVE